MAKKKTGNNGNETKPPDKPASTRITWHIERRKLTDITRWEDNPRPIMDKPLGDLKRSIKKFGLAEPLVVQPDGGLIGGHARLEALLAAGETEADCYVASRKLEDKERDELGVRLNKNIAGEFDFDILANKFEVADLTDWGFGEDDLMGFGNEEIADEVSEDLRPVKTLHVLVSIPVNNAPELLPKIEALATEGKAIVHTTAN